MTTPAKKPRPGKSNRALDDAFKALLPTVIEDVCPECDGSGIDGDDEDGDLVDICPECDGEGVVTA